jgi:hypothetical protein
MPTFQTLTGGGRIHLMNTETFQDNCDYPRMLISSPPIQSQNPPLRLSCWAKSRRSPMVLGAPTPRFDRMVIVGRHSYSIRRLFDTSADFVGQS